MSVMKTPEQIAFDLAQEWRGKRDHIVFTEATLIAALKEAIEADRAQPNYELGVDLPSGQRIIVWVGTSGADGSALVQVDTANAEGNLRIFVNDNDQPIFDENPETGKYEDMAPENEEDDDDAP